MLSGKRVLITGGAGFIGTHLSRVLLEDNEVVIFDTLRRNALQHSGLDRHPRLTLVRGDVLDAAAVVRALDGCTHVVHLASIAGVDTVIQNPVPTMQVSLLGTSHVLEAARVRGGIERVIHFSTSEVFGRFAFNAREGDVTSLGAVGEARWTYAVSKLAAEHLAYTYFKQYGLPTLSVRPFNIYGPMQIGEGAVHHFILRALRGETLRVHNDGSQIRSWCFIDDVMNVLLLALSRPSAVGHSFNIGNPRSTVTIYNLAREVVRLSGSGSPIEFVPWPHPDIELRVPNIDKARELLDYRPEVDLEEGLRRTIDWYRTQQQRGDGGGH